MYKISSITDQIVSLRMILHFSYRRMCAMLDS